MQCQYRDILKLGTQGYLLVTRTWLVWVLVCGLLYVYVFDSRTGTLPVHYSIV